MKLYKFPNGDIYGAEDIAEAGELYDQDNAAGGEQSDGAAPIEVEATTPLEIIGFPTTLGDELAKIVEDGYEGGYICTLEDTNVLA